MTLNWITAAFGVICFAIVSHALPVHDEDMIAFLQKMHHLKELDSAATIKHEAFPSTIRDILKITSLMETEKLDSETIEMMNVLQNYAKSRPKNSEPDMKEWYKYDEGSKAPLNDEIYVIPRYPIRMNFKTNADDEVVQSFKALSDVVASSLKENAEGRINIDIHFFFGKHGDKSPGNPSVPTVLSQQSGSTYFDFDTTETINEITEPSVDTPPDICEDASLDTIERTQDGSTYAFKGDYYWKINYNVTAPGYPRKISDDWGGLEGNLDASFTFRHGKTYFFKGERYWRFTNREMDPGFPQLISEGFKGIPDNLDAALVWSQNGKPYFFKGKDYWRYDVNMDPPVIERSYPAPVSSWKGLPADGVDAAFVWDNNKSYFFKRGQYYRFDDDASEVSRIAPYPCSTALNWFSCKVYGC